MKLSKDRQVICVQGMGFVGAAMAMLIASTVKKRKPLYNVYGLELKNQKGIDQIKKLNNGEFITTTTDKKLKKCIKVVKSLKNFHATYDKTVISKSNIIICNVNLDIVNKKTIDWDYRGFEKAIITIAKNMSENSLLIIETTVPPGTCEKLVLPLLQNEFVKRKMNPSKILLAHSFERVMPGENYLDSIKNFWRVFSANNNFAAKKCSDFYSSIINTKKYNLIRLKSMKDSEFCKILENTYRAVNIAFVDEWSRLAEVINVDMFEVIKAIKVRPTHSNIMRPGFGVGGYCLTKDPLFGFISASKIFNQKNIKFPITSLAININKNMPISSVNILKKNLKSFKKKKIAIFGVTYRENVGDCRYSPATFFAETLEMQGAKVVAYDPMIKIWDDYKNLDVSKIPNLESIDALVMTVAHNSFKKINFSKLLKFNQKITILDTFNILTNKQIAQIKKKKCKILSIGRGIEQ